MGYRLGSHLVGFLIPFAAWYLPSRHVHHKEKKVPLRVQNEAHRNAKEMAFLLLEEPRKKRAIRRFRRIAAGTEDASLISDFRAARLELRTDRLHVKESRDRCASGTYSAACSTFGLRGEVIPDPYDPGTGVIHFGTLRADFFRRVSRAVLEDVSYSTNLVVCRLGPECTHSRRRYRGRIGH